MRHHSHPAESYFQTWARLLTTAAANAALYHPQHRQVLRLNRQTLEALQKIFAQQGSLTVKIIDEQVIFADQPVMNNLSVERLQNALTRNGISHLHIEPGIYAEELLGLVNILSKNPDIQTNISDSEHIAYGRVAIRYQQTAGRSAPVLDLSDIVGFEADRYMDIYDRVKKKQKLELSGIEEIVSGFINAFNSQSEAFLAIAPLRSMDEYTYTHSTNICMLNLAQAKVLGIEGQLLNDIGIAAMLHDVGKMFISPEILSKSEQLNEDEWRIMQQHPRLGAEYLINTPGVPRLAVVTAFEHHMRYDHQGYPQTTQPWPQHLASQMTAISDTYDAMRTHRAYEEALELDQIMAIMLDLAGTKLHPQLTYSFLQVLSGFDKNTPDQNNIC
ncbi:MAG: HD domain-containing protein [Desulfuromonadales bacterium]|nr:HD domain-containing protein [Desulfuromonadales bacterium]MBN2791054.1 HD domain-containing protein [Desulfuromonadales bacterium]